MIEYGLHHSDEFTDGHLATAQPIAPDRLGAYQAAIIPLAESLALARSLPGSALAATE